MIRVDAFSEGICICHIQIVLSLQLMQLASMLGACTCKDAADEATACGLDRAACCSHDLQPAGKFVHRQVHLCLQARMFDESQLTPHPRL